MTREEYLSSCSQDRKASDKAHREYYGQFVTGEIKMMVRQIIGVERLKASKDPHFNDIPLSTWDRIVMRNPPLYQSQDVADGWKSMLPASVSRGLKEQGDYLTVAGGICIVKEAARQIVEEETRPVCPNCGQWQDTQSGDCLNECKRRGFAP